MLVANSENPRSNHHFLVPTRSAADELHVASDSADPGACFDPDSIISSYLVSITSLLSRSRAARMCDCKPSPFIRSFSHMSARPIAPCKVRAERCAVRACFVSLREMLWRHVLMSLAAGVAGTRACTLHAQTIRCPRKRGKVLKSSFSLASPHTDSACKNSAMQKHNL